MSLVPFNVFVMDRRLVAQHHHALHVELYAHLPIRGICDVIVQQYVRPSRCQQDDYCCEIVHTHDTLGHCVFHRRRCLFFLDDTQYEEAYKQMLLDYWIDDICAGHGIPRWIATLIWDSYGTLYEEPMCLRTWVTALECLHVMAGLRGLAYSA